VDTREKIVDCSRLAALLGSGEWSILAGFFDPMTAAQAKRIEAVRRPGCKLAAIIIENSNSLLPVEARAQLVAALRVVDIVSIAKDAQWHSFIPSDANVHIADEDPEHDRAQTTEFEAMILQRQNAGKSGAQP
jgi:hypothetical protein